MKIFLRITAGIYVLIAGSFMLLMGIIGMAGKGKDINPQALALGMGIVLFLAGCLIAIGVGIIMRKNWARLCLLVLSWLNLLDGIMTLAVTGFFLIAKLTPQKPMPAGAMYITFGFLAVFFIAIPLYFIIFFTRKSVKEMFNANLAPNNSGTPLGIKLLAITMVLGGFGSFLFWPFSFLNKIPIPLFFGIILSKWQGIIYIVILGGLNLFFGIGLYRLKFKAWVGTMCLETYSLLTTIVAAFTFNQEQYNSIISAMMPANLTGSVSQQPMGGYRFMYWVSAGFVIVIMGYLFSRRKAFVK